MGQLTSIKIAMVSVSQCYVIRLLSFDMLPEGVDDITTARLFSGGDRNTAIYRERQSLW